MERILLSSNEFDSLNQKIDLIFRILKNAEDKKIKNDDAFKKVELTIKESILYSNYSDSYIREKIKKEELDSRRVGAKIILIKRESLDKLIKKQTN